MTKADGPINVQLIDWPTRTPLASAKHAAGICYQAKLPVFGQPDSESVSDFVRDRLFWTGHHTTLEHQNFTFLVAGICVGDVTFGLHLVHPFYNSDQRSGRFCAGMFADPDLSSVERYVRGLWPGVGDEAFVCLMAYCRAAGDTYRAYLDEAVEITASLLRRERPHWDDDHVEVSAPKIAQEQLRMVLPLLYPTALDYSVNFATLVAMWESAFTPALRLVTDRMRDEVVARWPLLADRFVESRRRADDWACPLEGDPRCSEPLTVEVSTPDLFTAPEPGLMGPIDRLHFTPEFMGNSVGSICVKNVRVSAATYGQDQRHRTLRRGVPAFSGGFYAPEVVRELTRRHGNDLADRVFQAWLDLRPFLPATLAMVAAPYGAIVRYDKAGSFNAVLHEQNKRLCWAAQEEIYNLSRALRQQLPPVLQRSFEPPCCRTGRCQEGKRYCGRDLALRHGDDAFFPERLV